MASVLVTSDPRYHVNRKQIRDTVIATLKDEGIEDSIEISVAVVGARKMDGLLKQYMNDGQKHEVLSFPFEEGKTRDVFLSAPDGVRRLGDIVLCHPYVVEEAANDEVLVADKIKELVAHSVLHLLGHHHEE